jgi:hypothetical protein
VQFYSKKKETKKFLETSLFFMQKIPVGCTIRQNTVPLVPLEAK